MRRPHARPPETAPASTLDRIGRVRYNQVTTSFEQNKHSNVPSNEIFENHGGKEYVCNKKVPKIGAEEIPLVDAFGFGLP